MRPLSLDFIAFCKYRWRLSDEQLEHTILIPHTAGVHNEVSLRNALDKLFDTWNELVGRYGAELTKLRRYPYLSEDAYQCY